MAFQPVPEARLPGAGAGRAIPAAPDKLQESLKSPPNMALQSRKPWDTNSPIDRNPTKGDAPTNSCSEPSLGRGQITTSFTLGMPSSLIEMSFVLEMHCSMQHSDSTNTFLRRTFLAHYCSEHRMPRHPELGTLPLACLILLLQLSFCQEPIVQVSAAYATLFEV